MIELCIWIWLGVATVLFAVASLVFVLDYRCLIDWPRQVILVVVLIGFWPLLLASVAMGLLIDGAHFLFDVARKPH